VDELSNAPIAGTPGGTGRRVIIRPAADHELPAALRMIFCTDESGRHFEDEEQLRRAEMLAANHRHDAGGLWLAVEDDRPLAAVMPVISPGRSMHLYISPGAHALLPPQQAQHLIEQPCRLAEARGVCQAQTLLTASEPQMQALLTECGFRRVAELLYMRTMVARDCRPPDLPAGLVWRTYDSSSHAVFTQGVLNSYTESRDCPHLNDMRDIDDILADHRSTGQFDPALWFALCDGDRSAGVLLLARLGESMMELVYLGVSPPWRGRGIGDLLMKQALAMAASRNCAQLVLGVDAENLPALRLYWRHGMETIARRTVFVRQLRRTLSADCQHGAVNM